MTDAPQVRMIFHAHGAPDVLQIETLDAPVPGPGQVRVRVEASSVQFTDTLIRHGMYPDVRSLPVVPGYDYVGRVDAVGPGVTGVKIGDRVTDLSVTTGNARYVVTTPDRLVAVPETVDAAEATTLVLSWVTAYQALHRAASLPAGGKVFVPGGMGAVGQAVIQLARAVDAQVWTTARPAHHDALRAMGAIPLDYADPTWSEQVLAQSGGVDVVVDGVGADDFRTSRATLKPGGRLVGIGLSDPVRRKVPSYRVIWTLVRLMVVDNLRHPKRRAVFYNIASFRKKAPEAFREDAAALMAMLADGRIHPVVAQRIGFTEVAATHRLLETGGTTGKVVLTPWASDAPAA